MPVLYHGQSGAHSRQTRRRPKSRRSSRHSTGCRSRERGAHGPSPAVLRRTRGEERTVEEKDWETLTLVCDITIPELPLDKSPEGQLRFLRDYLARVRESTRYECYTYVERKVAELEAAGDSPFMGA